MTPFRSEKNTNWEGAFRVPCLIRWPGTHQGRDRVATRSSAASTGSRRCSPPPATRTSRRSCSRATRSEAGRSRSTSTATTSLPYLTGQHDQSAAHESSSTSTTTATWSACATRTGRSSSRSSGCTGTLADLGRAVHHAPRAEAVRPPGRPLRARRHHLEHLLRLVAGHVRSCWYRRRTDVRKFLETLQGVPARSRPPASTSIR